MKKNKNSSVKRILCLALALITLLAVVLSATSCGCGCGGEEPESWGQGEKEKNEDLIARITYSNSNWRNAILAAYRGYNVYGKNFKESESKEIKYVLDENGDYIKDKYKNNMTDVNTDGFLGVLEEIYEETDKENNRFVNDEDNGRNGKKAMDTIENLISMFKSDEHSEEEKADFVRAVVNSKHYRTNVTTELDASFPGIINVWIGQALGWITNLVGGYYVWALLLFALLIEILMSPLAIKQQKNTIGMAKLRPQIAKIEKKYAGRYDRATLQKKQQEIMDLQQKSGFSPFSGCLPLLIQLIIVGFILYPIIQNPLHYMLQADDTFSSALMMYTESPISAGGLGIDLESTSTMELLSTVTPENIVGIAEFTPIKNGEQCLEFYRGLQADMPNFSLFGANLGLEPSFTSILILVPILNVLAQLGSMYLNKRWTGNGMPQPAVAEGQNNNSSMKMMNIIAPVLTFVIMLGVPAMIGMYWLFRSVLAVGTKFVLKLAMPVPKFTEEELKEMEKADKERQKAQKEAAKQLKFRSLHYIDEEDYEELPESAAEKQKKTSRDSNIPEIKD